jgi:hypothetical protein
MIPAYMPPAQQLNACTPAQITAFVGACFATPPNQTACNNEQMMLSTSAAACYNCLFGVVPMGDAGAASNKGGVLLDYTGMSFFSTNSPGCIALEDPTNGPACAGNLEPLFQCELQACSSMACQTASSTVFGACVSASQMGACSAEVMGVQSSCTTDLGDGGVGGSKCGTDQQVLNAICGTGMN